MKRTIVSQYSLTRRELEEMILEFAPVASIEGSAKITGIRFDDANMADPHSVFFFTIEEKVED